jgi:VanZ family protein
VPVVLWAICITWFSTGAFSARSTNAYIDPALRYFFGNLSAEQLALAHAVIRKTAHFIEYAVLALLISRAITVPGARPSPGPLVRTLFYCALYAVADELHQTFETTRTGSAADVALDALGAAAGVLLFAWLRREVQSAAAVGRRAVGRLSARSRG